MMGEGDVFMWLHRGQFILISSATGGNQNQDPHRRNALRKNTPVSRSQNHACPLLRARPYVNELPIKARNAPWKHSAPYP
jgi:hypothetical protein